VHSQPYGAPSTFAQPVRMEQLEMRWTDFHTFRFSLRRPPQSGYYEMGQPQIRVLSIRLERTCAFQFFFSFFPSMALWPFAGPWPLFKFLNPYTVGRTPWKGDQPVAIPLPSYRIAQTQNKRTDIHVSRGIRPHDHSV
jgi:hypothetical protein